MLPVTCAMRFLGSRSLRSRSAIRVAYYFSERKTEKPLSADHAGLFDEALAKLNHKEPTNTERAPNPSSFSLSPAQLEKIIANDKAAGKYVSMKIYNGLIEKYCAANDRQGVLKTLASLKTDRVQPSPFIYTQVIGFFCKHLELELALQYYNEMKAQGIGPHTITYSALIFCSLSSHNEARAHLLFQDMLDSGVTLQHHPFQSFIRHYSYDPAKQMEWYQQMVKHNITEVPLQTFVILMKGQDSNFEAVMKIFQEELPRFGLTPNDYVYSNVISIAGKHDLIAQAESLFAEYQEMVQKGQVRNSCVVYTALMSVYRRHNPRQALTLFAKLKDLYQQAKARSDDSVAKALQPTFVTYAVAIEAAGQIKDLAEMELIFREALRVLPSDSWQSVISSLIVACAKIKNPKTAFIARNAFEMGYQAQQLDVRAYSGMIHLYCETKRWEKAAAIFELTSFMPTTSRPWGTIIQGAAYLKRFDEAEKILKQMKDLDASSYSRFRTFVDEAKARITANAAAAPPTVPSETPKINDV